EESLLVVGEPGSGKSGVLYKLAKELKENEGDKRDVVFLAVDRIAAENLEGLRNELGLKHNLRDVLKNWPGVKPGFLIIDALAAR
ncbi:MAG: ATP-binding protein, partial [Deltaproteobacteria bacterium]|nr:ATP-binding protein [Deltaproteobacteria bacterium]